MASNSDISARSTHDLWVESRQFRLEISRPTPTSILLSVTRPTAFTIVDGAVITLNTKAITPDNYPSDGVQYVGSTDFAAPANRIVGQDGAHVISFYSQILGVPFPAPTLIDVANGTETFEVTITNTDPNTLYFASIHPSSNVLQYYPIGIQSYPLEGSRVEKDSSSFTGNIPSLPEAPLAPTVGTVYFDEQLNLVQYWSGTQWIPTRSDAILSGEVYPGVLGQTYMLGGSNLQIFNGTKWASAADQDLQFLIPGPGWAPLAGSRGVTRLPDSPVVGDFIWNYTSQRPQYWDGANWIQPDATNTLFDPGSGLTPAFTTPFFVESVTLPNPYIGQLFYNTTLKILAAFNGTDWVQVNTDQQGTPSTDKIAIGTDGSYDERVRLIKVLKGQLGWPQTCVELKEEQFNIGIDNALDNYRMWSDAAYRKAYIMFLLTENQQTYYLNSAVNKTDRIVDVQKVHRLNVLGIQHGTGGDAIWSSGILTSYYSAATVDILSLHLLSSLSEEFQRIFAGDMTFLWDEPSRELFLTRKVTRAEKVILECMMERTEQEILVDRWAKQFIQNWALAECKMQLGLIRSRFSSGTPGAAGTITQNGELLVSEARQDMTELKEEILAYEYGGHVNQGNVSFLIG